MERQIAEEHHKAENEGPEALDEQYVLVTGNPGDGFEYFGPFNDAEAAGDYGRDVVRADYWWVSRMLPPTEPRGY